MFIRHSLTEGNLHGRYIGTTDESLCQQGMELLQQKQTPEAQRVYVSPMKRCMQTAKFLYQDVEQMILEDFKECNFGDFENKNYKELETNPDYQAWIDSNGTLPFPNGESHEQFVERCCKAFEWAMEDAFQSKATSVAFVVHGGTIMGIMERFALPKKSFFHWQLKNAQGIIAAADQKEWEKKRNFHVQGKWTGKTEHMVEF